ncbi:MAG TPA: DMT family transporter [Alphaproteobacteria bacterium]|nr:DMT family transporter [Alphaproteobacteria bacterium]
MNPGERPGVGAILLLAFVTFAWGFSWPVTKVALEQVPVWHLRAGTTLIGGLGMLALARLLGHAVSVSRGELLWLAVLAQFNVTGWCLFSAYGVGLMDAGRAGIIAFTMPIWAAMLAAIIGQERMTATKLLALALGVAGLCALLLPQWRSVLAGPYGVLAMLGSAVSWAIGTLGIKHRRWSSTAAVQSGWQLFFGSLPMAAGMMLVDERFDVAALDGAGWATLLYLIVISMLLAQWAWFRTVHALSATIAGIGTLMVPVIGVIGGAVWLGERIGFAEVAALLLIGASVALVVRPRELPQPAPQPPAVGLGLDPGRPG